MTASTEESPAGTPAVTAPEPAPVVAEPARAPVPVPSPPPSPSRARRWLGSFGQWFVRGRSIRDAKLRAAELPPRQRELFERAKSALQAARDAHEPAGPLVNGAASAFVLELCRESVHWSLAADEVARGVEIDGRAATLSELWARADGDRLLRAAGDPETLSLLESTLARASFVGLAELPARTQSELAPRVLAFSAKVLGSVDIPDNVLARLRAQRTRRLSAVLVVLLLALVGAWIFRSAWEVRTDLARGKAWKASSSMGGCRSPKQSCGESPLFFVHTLEDATPWVEFDLGAPRTVSAVRVLNRKDCCPDRALPLAIELSEDHVKYREVARRTKAFMSHRADFPPQRARWVRIRVLRKSWLHLRGVLILP